jgi:hypothetical protein
MCGEGVVEVSNEEEQCDARKQASVGCRCRMLHQLVLERVLVLVLKAANSLIRVTCATLIDMSFDLAGGDGGRGECWRGKKRDGFDVRRSSQLGWYVGREGRTMEGS